MATALEARINQMQHPITGQPVGGVVLPTMVQLIIWFSQLVRLAIRPRLKLRERLRFGLQDIPLGIGNTTEIKTPVKLQMI